MTPTATAATLLRVLIVDDDSISLELAALLLAANGSLVECASGGQAALDLLHTLPQMPDVVLVDFQMPGVSGEDVGRHITAMPAPRPRVIAMSATPLPPAQLALFDGFLLKPIDRDQLRTIITGTDTPQPFPPLPAQSLPPALDPSIVARLQAIMPPGALHELYTVYVNDSRQRIEELERCAAQQDDQGLRRIAHALKGSSAMVGVPAIATIAAALETGTVPSQEYSKLFHEMRSACDDVERSMTGGPAPAEKR